MMILMKIKDHDINENQYEKISLLFVKITLTQ